MVFDQKSCDCAQPMVCTCDLCTEIVAAQQQQQQQENGGQCLRGFNIQIGEGILYDTQLEVKTRWELREAYLANAKFETTVIRSPALHHRLRVAFQVSNSNEAKVWRFGVQQRNPHTNLQETDFSITIWPVATLRINMAMKILLQVLNSCDAAAITHGLYSVNMLDTMGQQDLLVALYYTDFQVEEGAWETNVRSMLLPEFSSFAGRVKILAHCKRQHTRVVSTDGQFELPIALETGLFEGKTLMQEEGHFSNPNGAITQLVNEWLKRVLLGTTRQTQLVELCSGCGNHTVGLAGMFSSVLSVEIDCKLVGKARSNIAANGIQNVQALVGDVNRLRNVLISAGWKRNLNGPTVVLVDPPRCGLSENTVKVLCDMRFDYLVYIACGDGLKLNMATLTNTYALQHLCLADHFPFTHFMEKIGMFKLKQL